jgi:hypothetical protein
MVMNFAKGFGLVKDAVLAKSWSQRSSVICGSVKRRGRRTGGWPIRDRP